MKSINERGSGYSQFVELIRQYGHNKDTDIELATVTSAPPNLRIQIDNMRIELDADDLVLSERVTDYIVTLRYSNGTTEVVTVDSALKLGDRVIVASINEGQTYIVLDRAVI